MRVMEILSAASNTIAEGEVLQLLNCNDPDTTEEKYMEVIRCKTAKLFEAAAQLGPVLANESEHIEHALSRYGMHLGTSFQLIDDILDYRSDSQSIGKNVGDDLAEGKPTLPIIYALKNATSEQTELLRTIIRQGDRDQLDQVLEIIQATNALQYTEQVARQEAENAKQELACLAEGDYKTALNSLAEFSVSRLF